EAMGQQQVASLQPLQQGTGQGQLAGLLARVRAVVEIQHAGGGETDQDHPADQGIADPLPAATGWESLLVGRRIGYRGGTAVEQLDGAAAPQPVRGSTVLQLPAQLRRQPVQGGSGQAGAGAAIGGGIAGRNRPGQRGAQDGNAQHGGAAGVVGV